MCACVGACGSVCWNPTFQLFVFFALLAAAAYSYGHYHYACGPLLCMCGNDVCVYALCVYSHVRTANRYKSNRTACLCGPLLLIACVDIAYVCVCAMIRKHVACATTTTSVRV